MYERPCARLKYVAKSYSSSAILKHWKAGTECACSAVFETCLNRGLRVLDQARALDPYCRSEGSWALGTRISKDATCYVTIMRLCNHFGIFTSGQLQSRPRCWILKYLESRVIPANCKTVAGSTVFSEAKETYR